MTWVAAGVASAAATAAVVKSAQAKRARKKQAKLINNRPEYKINEEVYDNQAIARSEAYGRDRAIQGREKQMDVETSQAVSDVQDVTTGTSSLLSTIAAIRANQDVNKRALAVDEASLQAQKKSQLLNVNNQVIDEKDKAWNYNTNMPYQMKIQMLRDRIKDYNEQSAQYASIAGSSASNMNFGGGGGGQQGAAMGGGANNNSAYSGMNKGLGQGMNYGFK
jgi:hypothetical protein